MEGLILEEGKCVRRKELWTDHKPPFPILLHFSGVGMEVEELGMKGKVEPGRKMKGKIYFNICLCFSLYKSIFSGNK